MWCDATNLRKPLNPRNFTFFIAFTKVDLSETAKVMRKMSALE